MTSITTGGRSISPEAVFAAVEPADFAQISGLLTDEERAVRARVREFVDRRVTPISADYWDRGEFPFELLPDLGRLGIVGGYIHGYGCAGLSSVGYGLALQELARGSGSLATFFHVQSGLAMTLIHKLGSDEQRDRWIPQLARCEKIGAFGLTEPDVGSDAGSLHTVARGGDGGYVLNGAKRWIGNASFADVAVIVARGDDGKVGAFLVEGDTPGYRAEVIPRKGAQRAVWQAEIILDNCRIPEENRLPGARGLGAILGCLTESRYGVAWDGLGQALDCYEIALAYTKVREQFGQPLAAFQLVQQKLVTMVAELSAMQVLSVHVGRLKDAGEANPALIAMLKMSNLTRARAIAALAREVMGGNGILLDYRAMEHMADIEGAYTYEGTNDVNLLIVGQAITGQKAFASQSPARGSDR